jgi:hypothetical protein
MQGHKEKKINHVSSHLNPLCGSCPGWTALLGSPVNVRGAQSELIMNPLPDLGKTSKTGGEPHLSLIIFIVDSCCPLDLLKHSLNLG